MIFTEVSWLLNKPAQEKLISESTSRKGILLIITRKAGEGFFIGDDIRVTILDVRGKQIRLGIEAPITTVILRDDVCRSSRKKPSEPREPRT